MEDLLGVQVGHPTSNIRGKGETKAPVEWNVFILQDIVQTSLGTVLTDDAKVVRVLDCGSNKLAQVRVVQSPACGGIDIKAGLLLKACN